MGIEPVREPVAVQTAIQRREFLNTINAAEYIQRLIVKI